MKKLITSGLFVMFAVLGLQACDVTVGYEYGHHRRYDCNRYDRYDCGYYRGWHRRDGRRYRSIDEQALVGTNANAESPAKMLAGDYGIRLASAQKILAIANNTDDRKSVMERLDLDKADVKALTKLEMPSRASVDKVASALGEKSAKIEKLMVDFINDAKAQKSN